MRPGRKRGLAALVLALLLLPATTLAVPALSGVVTWVYDGDTLKVSGIGKVRLIGIDTPEKEASQRDAFYWRTYGLKKKRLRRIAGEALSFNIRHAKGKTVSLTLDREKRDKYGRLLAYVHLPDGRLLNRALLEEGLASVYRRFDFRLKEDFLAAEKRARQRKVGLWAK